MAKSFEIGPDKNFNGAQSTKEEYEWNRLVRVEITCLDPNKRAYTCDVFCAGNAKHHIRRTVPFGKPTHVEQILLDVIKDKNYTAYKQVKKDGYIYDTPYQAPAYNIKYLDPLTAEEMEDLKNKQLLAGE